MMTKYLTGALAALFFTGTLALAADNTEAMAREKAAWQAYKDKKADDFRQLAAPTYRSVYVYGIHDLDQEVAWMQKTTMNSFELGDFNALTTDPDTMVVTYTAILANATRTGGSAHHPRPGDAAPRRNAGVPARRPTTAGTKFSLRGICIWGRARFRR